MEAKQTVRERILTVASDLFYREGIRAVGIDRIIAESGAAKASFYRSFPTKDDLIVAYLEYRHRLMMERFNKAELLFPDQPLKQLYWLIDQLAERSNEAYFRGCSFMNTIVEFPDEEHPGHKKAVESRTAMWERIAEVARKAGAPDPAELTAQLRLLSNGAMMVAFCHRADYNPEQYARAARLLIEHQLAPAAKK